MANIFSLKHDRQSGKDIGKHKRTPTLFQIFMNFGSQAA